LNLTPAQLLENKPLLTSILSYHVIPAGAVTAANVTDGMSYATLLPGANLTAHVNATNATNVTFSTPEGTNATVVTPDIMAGMSVVHIIDTVLVPPMNATSTGGGAGAGNMTMGAGAANETMGAAGAAPAASPAAGNTTEAAASPAPAAGATTPEASPAPAAAAASPAPAAGNATAAP
jgi:transforming growth factor-beta-induced protein